MPSSKRSAASSTNDKRRKSKTFFVDRSVGRYMAVNALREAGYLVVAHDDEFPQSTLDEEWLPIVGKRRWIVITRDKMIKRRQNEVEALCAGKVIAFVVSAANATGEEVAKLLVSHADRMIALATGAKPPKIYRIARAGAPVELALSVKRLRRS